MLVNVELPSILRQQEVCFVQLSMAQSPGLKDKATSVLCLSLLHPGPVPPAHFKTKLSNLDLSLMPSSVRLPWTMTPPSPPWVDITMIYVEMLRTFRLIDHRGVNCSELVATSGVSNRPVVAKHLHPWLPPHRGSSPHDASLLAD